jgi:hypothetical protein
MCLQHEEPSLPCMVHFPSDFMHLEHLAQLDLQHFELSIVGVAQEVSKIPPSAIETSNSRFMVYIGLYGETFLRFFCVRMRS